MAGSFFRGTTIEQDQRFGDAFEKLLKQVPASGLLKKPVDMSKVNMDAIKPWIADRVSELLGIEDEVLYEYVVNMLSESEKPDARTMQVNLAGFLEDKAGEFMQSLWALLLEAQKSPGGIPESLIQNKIEELKQRREEQQRAAAGIKASNTRLQEQQRKTRSGKRSRWDTPAPALAPAPAARYSAGASSNAAGTTDKGGRRLRTGRSRSPSPARSRVQGSQADTPPAH
ncbi:Serine/arginine repetitive matrix protein 1 [Coemansia biformis]|uniref:Serine/arginine repetitive matrix protein 1 n=1 Tax=Coemansia biformis TaxID=1286918 RepID=A0A9W8CTX2_9FUNG|nr:Serine/arginine repetitive matrix protein 1 [Coemansia biformis]